MQQQPQEYLISSTEKQWFFQQEESPSNFIGFDFNNNDQQKFNYVDHYHNVQVNRQAQNFNDFMSLDQKQKIGLQNFSKNNKYINGLNGFVTLGGGQKCQNKFQIEEQYGPTKFLYENQQLEIEKEQVSRNKFFDNLFKEIQKKQKRVSNQFVDYLQNFIFIEQNNQNKFLQGFIKRYQILLTQNKKLKNTNPFNIFNSILEFWMNNFSDMIEEIFKCNQAYTLQEIKNLKQSKNDLDKNSQKIIVEPDRIKINDLKQSKEKRQIWTANQTQKLNSLINQYKIIDSQKISQIATQFGRSIVSVQSKIQKILKNKKEEEIQNKKIVDIPIQKKIMMILKGFPNGLTKQEILEKLKNQFQMGQENKWIKSASQLISSSKNIIKEKGKYGLSPTFNGKIQNLKTFKNKIIKCLNELPSKKGDIKVILKKYIQLFGQKQSILSTSQQQLKLIQANIYKTLHRYQQFDKTKSKTLYCYIQIQRSSTYTKQWQMQSEF